MERFDGLVGYPALARFEHLERRGWLPRGWIDGFILSNDSTDATNDIAISAGTCRSTSNIGPDGIRTTLAKYQADLEIPVAIIKQLDVAWAPENYEPENGIGSGSRSGMRSSSAISNTTWHIFAIGGFDCPTDIFAHDGVDPSAVLPNGYTAWRRIGSVIRSSGAILGFSQSGDHFHLDVPLTDVSAANPGTSAVTRTLTVPTGVIVFPVMSVTVKDGTSNPNMGLITSLAQTDTAPTNTLYNFGSPAAASTSNLCCATIVDVPTNTSAQVRSRLQATGASDILLIVTHGWRDARGRDN